MCFPVEFEITDIKTGKKIADFKKVFRMENCIQRDAAKFELNFDKISDPTWKGLILAATLFMGFQFFTQSPDEARKSSALGHATRSRSGERRY